MFCVLGPTASHNQLELRNDLIRSTRYTGLGRPLSISCSVCGPINIQPGACSICSPFSCLFIIYDVRLVVMLKAFDCEAAESNRWNDC